MDNAIVNAAKVQIGHLDEKNFKTWRYKMLIILKAMPGCMDVLNGSKTKPIMALSETATEKAIYEKNLQEYNYLNSTILLLLTSNMSEKVLQKLIRFDNAKDMWEELERLFGGSCVDKTYDLCLPLQEGGRP